MFCGLGIKGPEAVWVDVKIIDAFEDELLDVVDGVADDLDTDAVGLNVVDIVVVVGIVVVVVGDVVVDVVVVVDVDTDVVVGGGDVGGSFFVLQI